MIEYNEIIEKANEKAAELKELMEKNCQASFELEMAEMSLRKTILWFEKAEKLEEKPKVEEMPNPATIVYRFFD